MLPADIQRYEHGTIQNGCIVLSCSAAAEEASYVLGMGGLWG